VLLLPLFGRVLLGHALIPGAESYAHLVAAAGPDVPLVANPYDMLLRLLAPLGTARILLSTLLGILTVVLFQILRKEASALELLLFLNPAFIALFTHLSPLTVAVPLLLAAFLARRAWLSRLFSVGAILFSPLVGGALALLRALRTRTLRDALLVPLALVWGLLSMTLVRPSADMLLELGGAGGVAIFLLALAFLEVWLGWKDGAQYGERGAFLLLLALGLLSADALLFAALLAGVLVLRFVERLLALRWTVPGARFLVLLLIGCALFFLLLSHLALMLGEEPRKETMLALRWLPPDNGVVLAPPLFGPIIRAQTGHPVMLDIPTNEAASRAAAQIYAAYRADRASELLDRYNVTYILITQELRDTTWLRDDEGLLFLLQHSNRFVPLTRGTPELWRYQR
jgi:MFS family permease